MMDSREFLNYLNVLSASQDGLKLYIICKSYLKNNNSLQSHFTLVLVN